MTYFPLFGVLMMMMMMAMMVVEGAVYKISHGANLSLTPRILRVAPAAMMFVHSFMRVFSNLSVCVWTLDVNVNNTRGFRAHGGEGADAEYSLVSGNDVWIIMKSFCVYSWRLLCFSPVISQHEVFHITHALLELGLPSYATDVDLRNLTDTTYF